MDIEIMRVEELNKKTDEHQAKDSTLRDPNILRKFIYRNL